jgi:hypothetical protein
MATYKVTGQITIYLKTEFEDDGKVALDDQAHNALRDEAIYNLGSDACDGEIDIDGYEEVKA